RLDRSNLFLFELEISVVGGVKANRLLARERLLGMELAFIPPGLPRNRHPHSPKRVVRVDRPQRADLLHVIRAATRDSARLEDAPLLPAVAEHLRGGRNRGWRLG